MAGPAAEGSEASPAAPGGGAVGGSSQIVSQIETLLAQLQQEEPDPSIQRLVKQMAPLVSQLQQIAGQDDTENMQSGLHNPGAEPGAEPGEAGGKPALTIAIHAGEPKPKDFKGARNAAKAAMESGSLPKETERTAHKRKG